MLVVKKYMILPVSRVNKGTMYLKVKGTEYARRKWDTTKQERNTEYRLDEEKDEY